MRLNAIDLIRAKIATHFIPTPKLPQLEQELSQIVYKPEDPEHSKREIKELIKNLAEAPSINATGKLPPTMAAHHEARIR